MPRLFTATLTYFERYSNWYTCKGLTTHVYKLDGLLYSAQHPEHLPLDRFLLLDVEIESIQELKASMTPPDQQDGLVKVWYEINVFPG